MTALSHTVLARLDESYTGAADPVRAVGARAYMRDQFPFLGITSPRLRELDRAVTTGLAGPDEDDLVAIALGCWEREQREFQYFGCGYLRRHIAVAGPGFINTLRHLVITRSWWDTVDALAAHVAGPLVTRHPGLTAVMDAWAVETDLWLVRTAILHQLRYGERTDVDRLFGYCAAQAEHRDFFIRKAVGWALRQYAKTDPDAVRMFVHDHQRRLSQLSVREALKNISTLTDDDTPG